MAKPIREWIEQMRAAHERADREEFARVKAMSQEQRIAALQAASLTAQRLLEVMSPEARVRALTFRDPLPESSLRALQRLREKAKHARV
jgi:hypothetical protein